MARKTFFTLLNSNWTTCTKQLVALVIPQKLGEEQQLFFEQNQISIFSIKNDYGFQLFTWLILRFQTF